MSIGANSFVQLSHHSLPLPSSLRLVDNLRGEHCCLPSRVTAGCSLPVAQLDTCSDFTASSVRMLCMTAKMAWRRATIQVTSTRGQQCQCSRSHQFVVFTVTSFPSPIAIPSCASTNVDSNRRLRSVRPRHLVKSSHLIHSFHVIVVA